MPNKPLKQKKNLLKKQVRTIIILAVLAFFVILFAVGVVSAAVLLKGLPTPEQFNTRKISESTKIYDRKGEVLLYEIHGEEKRTVIPFEEIPETLKQATLSAEDAEFYNQPAYNIKAIIRAFIVNLKEGRISQGGSTITQQLARSVFLSREKTITRKLKELIIAIELESEYTKDEIFSLYLNQIPYGSNAYGVEAASLTFFNKSVKDLSLAEAALLASLPKAPSYYSPWGVNLEDLFDRQNYILGRMVEFGFVSEEEKEAAMEEEVVFTPPSLGSIKAPHFSLAVKDYLVLRYGEETTLSGGLKVVTTLDWEMQEIAEKVVFTGAERNEELYNGKNAALVAEDPKTGQVLALVGSRDYFDVENEGNFNVALQGLRQPGSALKPFAYLTAFQKGYPPEAVLFDAPTEFAAQNPDCPSKVDFSNENKECFHPQNFDGLFRGPVSFEKGLAHSINVPSVKVLYLAGFDEVLKTLSDFGITTLKERGRYGLSLILGGGEVKLAELVNAYAALAEEGVRHEQKLVLRIEDSRGRVLEDWTDKSERAYETGPVRMINQILSDRELRSGLFQSSLPLTVFPEREVALKTGTTNDYRDAWALGYTPSLVVGVWAGNNDNSPMGARGSSILAAVPIWSAFMKEILPKYPPDVFQKPPAPNPVLKPMLNGEYVSNPRVGSQIFPQLHSILYYVDKKNPVGPPPANPEDDPQFYNWENSVLDWAKNNIPNFFAFNLPVPGDASFDDFPQPTTVNLSNILPMSGSFVNSPVKISAEARATNGLNRIELYFNRGLVNVFWLNGSFYKFDYNLVQTLAPQNVIEIRVVDVLGKTASAQIIVFH